MYLYLLIEFQSTADSWMAVRMCVLALQSRFVHGC
ncbi:Rpn family recombination-promoting nuclease/putative transposase [Aquaspirillum sp. LM1]